VCSSVRASGGHRAARLLYRNSSTIVKRLAAATPVTRQSSTMRVLSARPGPISSVTSEELDGALVFLGRCSRAERAQIPSSPCSLTHILAPSFLVAVSHRARQGDFTVVDSDLDLAGIDVRRVSESSPTAQRPMSRIVERRELRELGYANVRHYAGGKHGWDSCRIPDRPRRGKQLWLSRTSLGPLTGNTLDSRIFCVLGRPHRQYWAGSSAEHLLRDASEEQAGDTTPPVSAHHDEIDLLLACDINDRAGRTTIGDLS
jgi:hypothetical protein